MVDVRACLLASPPELSAARAAATAVVEAGTLPSIVFGVSDAQRTLAVHAFSRRGERPVSAASVYFLASVTKPIVASAVMQLVDEGRLDLHAPVQRFLPSFRGRWEVYRVTSWHVLTHTSGLSDLPIEVLRRSRPSYERLVRKVCDEELMFEPGTRWSYASDSFYVLAEIVAVLTGMPFAEALERRLLQPLGMADTSFDPRPRRSRVALVQGLPLRNPIVRELVVRFMARATLPGGGLFGTVEDILRFGRALLPRANGEGGPRLLSEAAIDEMTRDQTAGITRLTEEGELVAVHSGLGWRLPSEGAPGSPRAFTHGGASGTRIWVDPGASLVFCFLSNLWGAPEEPSFEVLRAVYADLGLP